MDTDPNVRLSDVRRTLDWIRASVKRYPGLQILLDDVPEDDDDFQVPSPGGRRSRQLRARSLHDAPEAGAVGSGGLAGADGPPVVALAGRRADVLPPDLLVSLASGRKLPTRKARAEALAELKAAFRDRIAPHVDALDAGDLDLDGFGRELRLAIKDLHTASGVAAKGGAWADMDFAAWGRVGNRVQRQYQFADRFLTRIAASQDGTGKALSKAQIRANADLYADAATATFSAQEVADRGIDPAILRVQPGDGSTECRSRCRCVWNITVHSKAKGNATARWKVSTRRESCRTCLARGRAWRSIAIRGGRLVDPLPNPAAPEGADSGAGSGAGSGGSRSRARRSRR